MSTGLLKSYELGESFRLEPEKRLLTRDGRPVHLASRPFQVLLFLIEERERIVGRSELLDRFWEGHDVYDLTLTKCVSLIRKALDDNQKEQPRFIETRWAEGYRYIGRFEEVSTLATPAGLPASVNGRAIQAGTDMTARGTAVDSGNVPVAVPTSEAMAAAETDVQPAQASVASPGMREPARAPQRLPDSRRIVPLVVGSLLVFAFIGLIISSRRGDRSAGSVDAPLHSIAVMPLKNLTADPANEYFSDGMTESLISALSRTGDLKVTSSGSVFRFKGKEVDPREVGRQLDVAAVLEGSVRKSNDSVRVAVRLVSVDDGRVLWTHDTNEHALSDIFALQDEMARNLAARLKVQLGSAGDQHVSSCDTSSVEAYELYLKGRYFWNKRTDEGLRKGIEHFEQAVKLDPNYARAYAGLADSYLLLNLYGSSRQEEVFPKAKAAAEKALTLDDTLAETHTTLAYIKHTYEWDWAGAERGFKRAIELNPNYETAHQWYSEFLTGLERFDEAIVEIEKAHELSPYSLVINSQRAAPYFYSRRYDEAIARYLKVREMDPNFPLTTYGLALSYEQQGKFDEAIAEFQVAIKQFGSGFGIGPLGHAYAVSGRKAVARALLKTMLAQSRQRYVSPYRIALVYAGLKEKDQAFAWLQKALDDRDERLVRVKIDPQLNDLHSDARFAEVIRRVGLAR